MISCRDVENVSISKIINILKSRSNTYDVIINNASIETYEIRKNYLKTIIGFLSLILAASFLSSFIIYNSKTLVSVFFLLLLIIEVIIFLYSSSVYYNFYKAYQRQKTYRDIEIAIELILNNPIKFFRARENSRISIQTIDDFLTELVKSYNIKNKKLFFTILLVEWKEILFICLFLFICFIATIVLLFKYGIWL